MQPAWWFVFLFTFELKLPVDANAFLLCTFSSSTTLRPSRPVLYVLDVRYVLSAKPQCPVWQIHLQNRAALQLVR